MKRDGFTIVELLVALSLFAIVVSVVAGVFASSMRTQRAVTMLMAANDNASLVLEQMSREVRTGFQFSISLGGNKLRFINQYGEPVSYELNDSVGSLERNGVSLTSENVLVNYLSFGLLGEEVGDGQSTRVIIRIGVSSTDERVKDIVTSLQTSVSSRQLDI